MSFEENQAKDCLERKNVGAALVELLGDAGVERAYTVPGESYLEILDAIQTARSLSLISTRHESGAAFMAEADAKVSGKPAVVLGTRGVGAANLSIGVHTAYQDSTPMLVLLGQVETRYLGREAFQEIDLAAFYAPITKSSETVHRSDRVAERVARGLKIATSGRPGPVVIALPSDLLGQPHDAHDLQAAKENVARVRARPSPSTDEIEATQQLLAQSARPIVIAGEGASRARDDLVNFAEFFGTGVYTSFRRQDVFPNDHPLYLGHLGFETPDEILEGLRRADLLIVLGSRLDEVTTQGYSLPVTCDVVQIDVDPYAHGSVMPVRIEIVASCDAAIKMLLSGGTSRQASDWSAARAAYIRWSTIPPSRSDDSIDPATVFSGMEKVFPPDVILTNDAGNFSAYLHRYWSFKSPTTQVAPANGAMGYAVPSAIGAKLAAPDRTVVALAGDGGFLMSAQEIETAVRYSIPIVVVVFRNGLQGTIAMHQAKAFGRMTGIEISDVDIVGYARSLGAHGIGVTTEQDLSAVLSEAMEAEEVVVLDIATDPDLITPSSRLSELIASNRAAASNRGAH